MEALVDALICGLLLGVLVGGVTVELWHWWR
jgi:hypothetical protein